MSSHNVHFHNKIRKISKISLDICFLELSEAFSWGLKNEFELAMINESSVFDLLRFHCI